MELLTFAKEVLHNIAEQVASYRLGQTALRHLDRALWVVEKCARWAVPPPLDQDERPQPELIRPLPWVFFLSLLVILRITRESISLINLVLGKPPLRSADVVVYIQSKRRYLRTLKYQGNRMMRMRTSGAAGTGAGGAGGAGAPWYSAAHSLLEFTMCFRRQSHYGNNNTTSVSNNDEILVVKRSKNDGQSAEPIASTSETTMERLIEKMMVDLDAESDEDSSITLTNVPSLISESEVNTESDPDTVQNSVTSTPVKSITTPTTSESDLATPPSKSTPDIKITEPTTTKAEEADTGTPAKYPMENISPMNNDSTNTKESRSVVVDSQQRKTSPEKLHLAQNAAEEKEIDQLSREDGALTYSEEDKIDQLSREDGALTYSEESKTSAVEETQKFLQGEKCTTKSQQPPKKEQKIVNGRTKKSAPNKKRGGRERRESDVPVVRITPVDNTVGVRKEKVRQPHQNVQ